MADLLGLFIGPLETWLNPRLVRAFLLTPAALVRMRHNRYGLLLSEFINPYPGPVGAKGLGNLLRSPKWSHTLLAEFLWHDADQRHTEMIAAGERALAIRDESVLEQPESNALEGLCPVGSNKVARLKGIKPGYYDVPGGPPVSVPGRPRPPGQPSASASRHVAGPMRPAVAAAMGDPPL
ncbi:MAG: hypothetical protein J4G13_04790 [Dehalococcoidia bacterium]|nr:hypothetical protein [Dehalococcoidia bacterium]